MPDFDFLSKPYIPDMGGKGNLIDTYGKFQEIQQRQIQMDALQNYSKAIDAGVAPEVAARHLLRVNPKAFEETQNAIQRGRDVSKLNVYGKPTGNLTDLKGASPEVAGGTAEAEDKTMKVHGEWLGRRAHEVISEKDPTRKRQLWDDAINGAADRGIINDKQFNDLKGVPVQTMDSIADGLIKRSMGVAQNRETTGATSGADQTAREAATPKPLNPLQPLVVPNRMPGGISQGAPVPQVGSVATTPPPPPVGSTAPIVPNPVTTVPVRPGATAPATPDQKAAEDKAADEQLPYYQDAPVNRTFAKPRGGEGVISPGMHPAAPELLNRAQEQFEKDLNPTAKSAADMSASLSSLEAELKSGKVNSNRLAEIRMAAAGWISGVLNEKNGETGSKIMGIDLPWAQAANKETTRMGLNYSRNTIGAREAVAAIRIALNANPSMLTTVKGNLKIIEIMKAANDYEQSRADAATAYFRKQNNETGTPHLDGFDQWHRNTYSPDKFISRAVPYPYTKDTTLKDGVTYEIPQKGPDGKVVRDRDGEIQYDHMVYRKKEHGFEPAEGAAIK